MRRTETSLQSFSGDRWDHVCELCVNSSWKRFHTKKIKIKTRLQQYLGPYYSCCAFLCSYLSCVYPTALGRAPVLPVGFVICMGVPRAPPSFPSWSPGSSLFEGVPADPSSAAAIVWVWSSGCGYCSRTAANNTHSFCWPGARELEPVPKRIQSFSVRIQHTVVRGTAAAEFTPSLVNECEYVWACVRQPWKTCGKRKC